MRFVLTIIAPFLAIACALSAQAHEFWISPTNYQVEPGETILADLRVGENFTGSAYPYVTRSIERFDIATPDGRFPVTGRVGDRPAAQVPSIREGLHVLIHETTDNTLTYNGMEKFVNFARHKDQLTAVDVHMARGFSTERFMETYRRFAKALVAVGDGAGTDTRHGLKWELVALTNPYTDDLSAGFKAQLWREDTPVKDAQIELFAKDSDGNVTITLHRTNAEGLVTLPMTAETEYMVDSVELVLRSEDSPGTALWHSNWAALTFKTPG